MRADQLTGMGTIHRAPIRIRKRRVAALLVVLGAIVVAISGRSPGPSASMVDAVGGEHRGSGWRGELGVAAGAVPDGTTVFDGGVPGVAKLDPALLDAVRRAASQAANEGIAFVVDSGWRSRAYQQRLLDEAVAKYGSQAEASRWVATPGTSAHVSGQAIDIGPAGAAAWLARHGSAYGLCRIYGNEPWHYELRPDAVASGCPPVYADPTQDPRMRQ
ncbi:M15 family metallopeptidase [Patulibacter defluvii]|uniref:M15 family metallopeptidase n=1 Tax=Patulibacter defluvii TaxID=3095358 RepID=UPI002A750EE6|nr:M15 family metallopeptidase [Patulibacter sp. DM4]